MKINRSLHTCLQVFFVGVFILSLGKPSPVRAAPGADLHVNIVLNGASTFTQGEQARTYTIAVSNLGDDPTAGTITVTDTLPTGLTATAISGTGWSCTLGTLTCTRSDVLAGEGESYPVITLNVNVAVDAPTPATNTVTVSGGGDNDPEGNEDTVETDVIQKPDLNITGYQFVNLATELPLTSDPAPNQPFGIKVIVKNQGGADTSGVFYRSVFVNRNPMNPTLFTITSPEGCLYNIAEGENDSGDFFKENFFGSLPAGVTDTGTIVEIPNGLPPGNYQIYLYADPTCIVDDESVENNNSYGPIPILMGYTFQDVPTPAFAWAQIESIYAAGITGGCTLSPLNYCPNSQVLRSQMAIFLLRGMHGSSYTPPPADGNSFGDIAINTFGAAWIEQFAAEGITGGCGGGNYCPNNAVTRAQMAIFLLRAKYGSAYTPPAVGGSTGFTDVPISHSQAAWIKQLAAEGITGGCGGGNYCPNNPVTRSQMAIFIQRTFNLPLP